MNRIKYLLIALAVSPEVLVGLLVAAFVVIFPRHAAAFGETIRSDAEVWKYLPGLTFIFVGFIIKSSFTLRAPLESSSNKVLYCWPGYQFLVDRVYVGLFYGIASTIASLALWFFGKAFDPILVALIFLSATLVSGMTALTMLLAQQKLREILGVNL